MVAELTVLPAARIDAVETVRRHLLRLIELGHLASGERLPNASTIAVEVGASRPIVLQAAKLLESEGRIVIRQGGGMWVSPLSAENVDIRRARVWRDRHEIVQQARLREILEAGVAYQLAGVGLSKERLAAARGFNERMHENGGEDLSEKRKLDTMFHATLCGGLGMPIVEQVLLETRAIVSSSFEFLPWPADRFDTTHDEHELILRALEKGDAETAQRLAREHVQMSSRLIVEVLGGDDSTRLVADLPGVKRPRRKRA